MDDLLEMIVGLLTAVLAGGGSGLVMGWGFEHDNTGIVGAGLLGFGLYLMLMRLLRATWTAKGE